MSLIGNRGLPTTRMLSVGRETGIAVLGRVATVGRADLVGCFCSPIEGAVETLQVQRLGSYLIFPKEEQKPLK